MFSDWPLLSLVIWTPILGGALVLAVGNRGNRSIVRWLSLAASLLTFALSLGLYVGFDSTSPSMQFVERTPWIPAVDIWYHVGIDGISLPLIILTTLMTVLVVIAGWNVIQRRVPQYFAAFLIMEGLMVGVFSALDAILFYVFFEAMLIPMFLIIGMWGGPRRVYATIKFFLYTFLGSVFMLIGLIYLYLKGGSFAILDLHAMPLTMTEQLWIFASFVLAFAVKIPMWPVHTWLPDAHVEAPTGGSVILAAILLKIGGYGFLRFSLPVAPDASAVFDVPMMVLSLIAIIYIGLVALAQADMKKLIAYSSIAHMGFVTLGTFIVFDLLAVTGGRETLALEGAMVQMVSHGLISGALFLCVGVLYDRMHSRQIADYGGVVNSMPWFAMFMVIFAMANAGLPGTSGFVGELMVILATFKANPWYAFFAAVTLVTGAAYTLYMVKRVVWGDIANDEVARLEDINGRETTVLGVLAVLVLLVGVWPAPLIEIMEPSVSHLAEHIAQSKIP